MVFGGFAARELATRIEDAEPKVVLTASCGIEVSRVVAYKPLLDEAIELSRVKPTACLIFQRPQAKAEMVKGRDLDWAEAVAAVKAAEKGADCVPVAATDPLYILYTSGTTGRPKGVRSGREFPIAQYPRSAGAVFAGITALARPRRAGSVPRRLCRRRCRAPVLPQLLHCRRPWRACP